MVYFPSEKRTDECFELLDGQELPIGSLRANPLSTQFIMKNMFSKVNLKSSTLRQLQKFADVHTKY